MPLLTAAQLQELRQIIQDSATALAVTTFGAEVTGEELQRLADEGYLRPEDLDNLGLTAFTYGQLLAKLPHLVDMSYPQFVSYVRAHPVGMSDAEKEAYEVARQRAGTFCVGLGNRYSEELGRVVVNADQALAQALREGISGEVAESGAERESRGSLVRRLREMSGQMTRDWTRIADTETHLAAQEGMLEAVLDRYGAGELLAKRPVPDACEACKEAYLDENGNPKIFPASWWAANGSTNIGRKRADWLPVLGVMHPWCVVPGQAVTTHRGQVPIEEVRIGDLVVTAEGRWRPVRQVFRHFYSGEVVELFTESRSTVQRLVVTPDHLVGSRSWSGRWQAAKLIHEGAELLVFSDPEDRPPVSDQVLRFATVFLGFDQAGVPVSAIDFDGDLHILPAQIDKVTSDDGVVRERESLPPQMVADAAFQRGVRAIRLPAKAFDNLFVGLDAPAACTMSSRGELFALLGAESLVADLHSFAARVLLEPSLLDALGDGAAIHPQLAGYRQYGQIVVEVESQDLVCVEGDAKGHSPSVPAHSAIVKCVRRRNYCGPVYNLGVAEDESYLVQGTAVHNCRCELIRVPAGFVFNAEGQLVPESLADEDLEKASKPLPGQLPLTRGGPYIGPRGGKWADPEHTIAWEEPSGAAPRRAAAPVALEDKEKDPYPRKWFHGRQGDLGAAIHRYGSLYLTQDQDFASAYGDVHEIRLKGGAKALDAHKQAPTVVDQLIADWKAGGLSADLDGMMERAEGEHGDDLRSHLIDELSPDEIRNESIYDSGDFQEWLGSQGYEIVTFGGDTALLLNPEHIAQHHKLEDKQAKPAEQEPKAHEWMKEPGMIKADTDHPLAFQTHYGDLAVSVENRAGSYRRWYDKAAAREGKTLMKWHYGRVPRSRGVDGDAVDVFLKPGAEPGPNVYVITTMKPPEFKKVDEQKVMLGARSRKEAKDAYLAHYDDPRFYGHMSVISFARFCREVKATLKQPKLIKGRLFAPEQLGFEDLSKAGEFGSHAASIVGIQSPNTVGGMGHHSPGRTPGANVIAAEPVEDWPPFKKRKKRKKRPKLPRAAERLDIKGLKAPIGWANPPNNDQVQAESFGPNQEQIDSGHRYREDLEEQQRQRMKLRQGQRLVVPMHPRDPRE